MESDPRSKELLNAIFRLRGTEFSRCFAPPSLCPEVAVRAHSIQNARCLDLLESQGHIMAITLRLDAKKGPIARLDRVGRNEATTFAGLCADHDRKIFSPIETASLDLDDPEHRFLLAYRATFYGVHAACAAAWMVQTGYLKTTQLGINPPDAPSMAGVFAVDRMIVAYETFCYKAAFDRAYLERDFELLEHDLLNLPVPEPTVAASALFSLDHLERGDDVVRVCLTILPVESCKTVALFTYLKADAPLARKVFAPILQSTGERQKHELSRRLLNNCQNFVLSPRFVASWTPQKRKLIVEYFVRTVFRDDLEFDHPDLTLFQRGA